MTLTVTMQESGGFELHEEAEWYEGILLNIEEADDRGFGPGLKWIINLDGETDSFSGEPRETWAFCSQKLSPRSKLFRWAKGVLGEHAMPEPGGALDLAGLIGARIKIMFEHVPGTDDAGNPQTKERVVAMKTAGTTAATAAQVPSAQTVAAVPAAQAAIPEPF